MKDLAKELKKRDLKHMDHLDAKRFLMEKYLNTDELDPELCIFSFVGRITEQKGVDLITSVAEEFITSNNYKVAFIIGGPAQQGDPHGDMVISASDYLINKFPKNFYADPRSFFFDVPVLSLGSNFCLMPSRFEPGGIVQHEFFIAGTPAVVFATGGLKDSVTEYNYHTGQGNGFEFLNYTRDDLLQALRRAYKAFKDKEAYRRLRRNAFASAIDVADVSKEWCAEAYKLRGKVFIDRATLLSDLEEEKREQLAEQAIIPGYNPDEEEKYGTSSDELVEVSFKFVGQPTDTVYVSGTFNSWNEKSHRMNYDDSKKEFQCHVLLNPGKHQFKLLVNGQWKLDHHKTIEKDTNGEEVNVLEIKEK